MKKLLLLLFLVMILFTFYSGIKSYYYSNEQIKSEENYKDNNAGNNYTKWYDWANPQNQIWRELNHLDVQVSQDSSRLDGMRSYSHENGQIGIELNYKDGKYEGKSTWWYENGQKKYEVNFKDGKEDGKWSHWSKNGKTRSEVNYKDGKLNGKYTKWYESGQKDFERNYIDSQSFNDWSGANGKWIRWNENGQIQSVEQYKDGKQDGKWSNWNKNGQLWRELNYKDDKYVGSHTQWYENGQKMYEENYKDGKEEGKHIRWYENGQKSRESNYKDGKLEGKYTEWSDTGQIHSEGNYKDGEIDKWTTWDENGQISSEVNYKEGKVTSSYENGQIVEERNLKDDKASDEAPYQQESAGLYCEKDNRDLSLITEDYYNDFEGNNERISTGKCKFGDYQIEFYQHSGKVNACHDELAFCGIISDSKPSIPNLPVIVKDINGDVFKTSEDISEKAAVIELFRVPTSFPYMVLRTNLGGARSTAYLHIFTAKPTFKQIALIGPVSGWRDDGKYIYSNDQGEWLVDKFVTVPTPHLSALSDWLHFPVTYKFVDEHLERADQHKKANLKVYSETELEGIDEEALQIRALIDAQTNSKWDITNLLFSGKFFWRFTDFIYQGQEDLAWQFFERAIPDSYDMLSGYADSMYATKSIMRETMKKWIKEYFPLGAEKY